MTESLPEFSASQTDPPLIQSRSCRVIKFAEGRTCATIASSANMRKPLKGGQERSICKKNWYNEIEGAGCRRRTRTASIKTVCIKRYQKILRTEKPVRVFRNNGRLEKQVVAAKQTRHNPKTNIRMPRLQADPLGFRYHCL